MTSENVLFLGFILAIFATCQTVFSQNKMLDLSLLEGKKTLVQQKKQHQLFHPQIQRHGRESMHEIAPRR